ncbi:hypothetical protein B0H13DRAFT_2334984 [Mycena leptocephala]|nr:hypothetical protein B0H13DRAFT_2334984 [Mycena leptocephala]
MTTFSVASGTEANSVAVAASSSPNNTAALHLFTSSYPRPCPTPIVGFRTHGPWIAGALYVVVPTAPLRMVAEDELEEGAQGPTWYCITRGHYIGVTTSNALAINAVVGVSASTMKGHKTQAKAVQAFNELLSYNMVTVIA